MTAHRFLLPDMLDHSANLFLLFNFDTPHLPVRLATVDLFARLLDLLEHSIVGKTFFGGDFGGLGGEIDGVGFDA